MPSKNKKLSVMRHKNCSPPEILKIGSEIGNTRNSSLKAFCSILAKEVRSINSLDVESDTNNKQHKRHANIIHFKNYNDAKMRQIASDNKSLIVV